MHTELDIKTTKRVQVYAVAHLVKALRYNLEGHGFDFRWCINVILPTVILESI